jgi:putative peptidoglycan lipid II flippase
VSSTGRALARAGLIVSGAFLISRVLGWVRLVVIGNVFGASADLDALFAAFRLPDLIFQLVAAGALSSALIPVVSGVLVSDGEARAWRVISTVTTLMLIALLVMAAIVFVFADVLVPVITPGFDAETTATTVELTRIMVLGPVFLAMGAVATSVLNARDRFAAAAVAPIVYNLAIIGATLLLAPAMGVVGVAIGVVAGSLGHLLVQIPPLCALGARFRLAVDLADDAARRAFALMVPRAIGLGASQITFFVVTALASGLGVGALAAFTIAFTLLQIPIGVIGVPLGVVLFPSLSREAALGGEIEFRRLLGRAVRLLLVAMLPVAVLGTILRTETVALLFGSFSADAITLTAATFAAFLPGLPAHALIAVLARAFYARQDTLTPVLAAIGAVAVNCSLAIILVDPLGLPGMALAIATAAWLEAATLAILLRRRLGPLDLAGVGSVALRTAIASAAAGLAGLGVRALLDDVLVVPSASGGLATAVAAALTMLAVGAVFAATFALAALALRIDDLRSIVGLMVDAIRRPRAPRAGAS